MTGSSSGSRGFSALRWLVIGANGMFGKDLGFVLRAKGHQVTLAGRNECDVRSLHDVRRAVAQHEVVVNAAAWTAVDAAETDEADAFAINATGALNTAVAAREHNARLVHISTDYVFEGNASEPYSSNHPPSPQSAYGRTKAAGEWAVLSADPNATVVRTAWLYGQHGPNFVDTILRVAGQRPRLSVVTDQVGQPTWTMDLAAYVISLIESNHSGGVRHGTNTGQVSRFDLARAILELTGDDPSRVDGCVSADYPQAAKRPAYSVLAPTEDTPAMPSWYDALRRYLTDRVGARRQDEVGQGQPATPARPVAFRE